MVVMQQHVPQILFVAGAEIGARGAGAGIAVIGFLQQPHGNQCIEQHFEGARICTGLFGEAVHPTGCPIEAGEKVQFDGGVQGAGLPVAARNFEQS